MVEKISRTEIDEVKRQFILENTRLSPPEAARILGISVRTFYSLVEEGHIETIPLRPGQVHGTKCTAAALEKYRIAVSTNHNI